jgi:Domain of unknown function (DUF4412)
MKNILIYLTYLVVASASAQTYEGTITWSIKMEITDPAFKAKAEQAQLKMNDPATLAKMKEMESKMNDPTMKALMESNPQMKATMEKMMAGNMNLNSMIPAGYKIKLKDGNALTLIEGGITPNMEILFLKDKNQSYRLDRKSKSYTVLSSETKPGNQTPAVKITKTSETMKILNYTCTKYKADITDRSKTQTHFYWTTTEIKDFDMKSLAQQRLGQGGHSLYFDGIDGVALKMEITLPEGKMVMEVTTIKKETLNQNDFTIPSDFRESK